MNNPVNFQQILKNIQYQQTDEFRFDEQAITTELQAHSTAFTNTTIKGLSILGGILAATTFLGFLGMANLFDSEVGLLITGIIFIVGSVIGNRMINNLLLDTSTICFYILGYILAGIGLYALTDSSDYVILLFLFFSLATMVFTESFMLIFFAVIIFIGSLITWLVIQDSFNLIQLPILLTGISLSLLCYYEPAILSKNRHSNKLFKPFQAGFFVSFLLSMAFLALARHADIIIHRQWILSVFIWIGLLILLSKIIKLTEVNNPGTKLIIYLFVILMVVPTIFAPHISGAVFLMLITFSYGYKTEFVLSGLLFAYSITQYYYDLNLTLLAKSGILFSSGIIMLAAWLIFRKKFAAV